MSEGASRHLVLIGLMGSGKSTVGEACAARLGRPFVDTDELVLATTGRSIGEIFARGGEPEFRQLEATAVADVCASPEPLVISCGGGAVLDADNRKTLRGAGVVVWLRGTPATLAARVDADATDRPLLNSDQSESELERLAELRAPLYQSTAHAVVDTDDRSVEDVVGAVLEEADRCRL
jgi:shikimate kinase